MLKGSQPRDRMLGPGCRKGWDRAEDGARQKLGKLIGGIYARLGRRLELTPTRQLPRGACWGVFASTCFYMDQMYMMFYGHLYPRAWRPDRHKRVCWNGGSGQV